jgi:beta-lactamase class A
MSPSISRRSLLLAAVAWPLVSACSPSSVRSRRTSLDRQLAALEASFGGRIGVAVLRAGSDERLGYRADERFPMCSTFKLLAVAAVLTRSMSDEALLQRHVDIDAKELVAHSPITEKHVVDGMSVSDLCAAALQYSDNTAGNLLLRLLGGPSAVTAYARSIGDDVSRLDRWETELNSAIPDDPRDTTSPAAMAGNLRTLLFADALATAQRNLLQSWLRGNTTGDERIRAGVPATWQVGDKTGTGDYGAMSDIAVLWPPASTPMLVAIYTTQTQRDAPYRADIVAQAARLVAGVYDHASNNEGGGN